MDQPSMGRGRSLVRGDVAYEAARRGALWRTNTPDRYPDRIVAANSVDDVVAAVRAARAAGHRVSVRSGGHSWSGNHVRDGGVLIDVSRLTAFTVDKSSMTATVEPGSTRAALNTAITPVTTPQPTRAARSIGISWSIFTMACSCTHICSANADRFII